MTTTDDRLRTALDASGEWEYGWDHTSELLAILRRLGWDITPLVVALGASEPAGERETLPTVDAMLDAFYEAHISFTYRTAAKRAEALADTNTRHAWRREIAAMRDALARSGSADHD
jgi:hypothetical protein